MYLEMEGVAYFSRMRANNLNKLCFKTICLACLKFLKSATSSSKKIFQIDKCFYWSMVRGLNCVNGSIHQQFCLDWTWALHLIQNSICPRRDPFLYHAMRRRKNCLFFLSIKVSKKISCRGKVMQYITTTTHYHRFTKSHAIKDKAFTSVG